MNELGNELTVLKSSISEGIHYQPKKSNVAKSVKRKHQKKALSEAALQTFLCIFALPAFIIYSELKGSEYKIRNAGGYEEEEVLRGNAIGGGCLMIVACILWSYFICSALSTFILYMAGVEDGYWTWGFIVGILPCILILRTLKNINWKKQLK